MSRSHSFYFSLPLATLESIVDSHREEFDTLLVNTFSDDELSLFESKIDSIAAVYPQPILVDLQFDDFYPNPREEERQREFFERCQSSISLENIPFFETNPFQVTYLKELLSKFSEVLIDQGGVSELCFKDEYFFHLENFKDIGSILPKIEKKIEVKTKVPVDPIDFLVLDVTKEIKRLETSGLMEGLPVEELSEKVRKLFVTAKSGEMDPEALLSISGLNPKDFDDGLEKLKFWLRKF